MSLADRLLDTYSDCLVACAPGCSGDRVELSFAKTSYASKGLILPLHGGKVHVVMLNAIVIAIRFVLLMLSGQRQVALETGA